MMRNMTQSIHKWDSPNISHDESKRLRGLTTSRFVVLVVAGVLIFAVVLFAAPPALTAPTITWVPPSLNDQVATGQSKALSVSFISSEALSNVVVRVVPELQPFVR